MNGLMPSGQLINQNPVPKSCFINQLDGGYTLNLQGQNFYPPKVCVTTKEAVNIISNFFDTNETPIQTPTKTASESVPDQTPVPEVFA